MEKIFKTLDNIQKTLIIKWKKLINYSSSKFFNLLIKYIVKRIKKERLFLKLEE